MRLDPAENLSYYTKPGGFARPAMPDQDPSFSWSEIKDFVGELPELEGLVDWRPTGGPLPLDRHLFYVAEAKLLAVLPSSRDKLILRRVEVQ